MGSIGVGINHTYKRRGDIMVMLKQKCYAPGCSRYVVPTVFNTYTELQPWYLRLFKSPVVHVFCTEHLERITAGRLSDNDPSTNPDLDNRSGYD